MVGITHNGVQYRSRCAAALSVYDRMKGEGSIQDAADEVGLSYQALYTSLKLREIALAKKADAKKSPAKKVVKPVVKKAAVKATTKKVAVKATAKKSAVKAAVKKVAKKVVKPVAKKIVKPVAVAPLAVVDVNPVDVVTSTNSVVEAPKM
jgi:hypothetical protein